MKTIKSSSRLSRVPASPIRKLVPYAIEAEKKGARIFYFNIGDPDIETPKIMIDVLRNWKMNPIPYGRSHGDPILLKSLVSYYFKLGASFIKEENVLITTGGSEAISMAMFSVAEPGEEMIVFEPFYTNYNSYAAVNGIKLVPVRTYGKTGFHLPNRVEIEKKISKKTKAILICNPNNPTGTAYTNEEIEMLVDISVKNNLFFISDEVYREFVYDGKKHNSILKFMKKYPDKMILLDSLSKRYSLCGARLGMLVSLNKEIMDGVLRIAQGRLSAGFIDQKVAENLTEIPESYFKKNHQEYQRRRDTLYEGLKKIPGVFLEKPEGAFYAIIKLPIKDSENFCKWLLTDFRYKNETAFFAPAEGFYATPGLGKNEIRIAYILKVDYIKKAVEILRRALVKYKG
ncbi:pyridoxal phosphate-dependent aminotransferase [Candidatus Roizmanbacteria bacterium]|nr:pyridoxal phosphate-dependent aminotransferase [Candidatus Roizmanbacteria bacterium]